MIDRPQDLSLPSMLVGSLAIVPAMVAVGVLVIMTATTQTAQARVTRIVVNERISPAFNGRSFGTVGQYEQLNGIAYREVDPQDPQDVIIQDIGLALAIAMERSNIRWTFRSSSRSIPPREIMSCFMMW